ncbi:hypothetical protein SERLA73DRAFT_182301 [Serpula lacrymans var. lacrymans S7.3]|uniref:Uncharacterized protein n=2 Tax=Serpula lacrymans var. lacrymans TaxID=341189 RepID=F8PX77_SERL3|nr:uncharacterized protein SERLADRAFT_468881 [Serpula lacrymans var. lacrymans S7.9]EGN99352.1 hypothetical protein SERLA73DRAFT_182301 [Serpula lacrymans var. lacrymans S7.3]EGO24914.1 hypothetical protein SERLADRAFT_468881 [Serpula lacrymans var. lacrymans S7.9]
MGVAVTLWTMARLLAKLIAWSKSTARTLSIWLNSNAFQNSLHREFKHYLATSTRPKLMRCTKRELRGGLNALEMNGFVGQMVGIRMLYIRDRLNITINRLV